MIYRKDSSTEVLLPRYRACTLADNHNAEQSFAGYMARHAAGTSYEQLLYPAKAENLPPTITELAKLFQISKAHFFHEFVTQNFSNTHRECVQAKTHAQSKSHIWRQQRIGALTSTTFHKAIHYRGSDEDNYIVKEIMGQSGFHGTISTRYGKKIEPI